MTLPDDDGTAEAEIAAFKRKRQVKLAVSGALVLVATVVTVYLVNRQIMLFTTENQELAQLEKCDLNQKSKHYDPTGQTKSYSPPLSIKCNKVIIKLLRRLGNEPALCKRIAKRISAEKDWERQNRLLHVLIRSRHSSYWGDELPRLEELARQPCVEEPLVQMAARWNQHKNKDQNPEGFIPGVAQYNLHFLNHARFLVTKTYVLKRVQLPRPAARKLAAHVLRQFRHLNQDAAIDSRAAIRELFDNVFYPLWTKLGRPE